MITKQENSEIGKKLLTDGLDLSWFKITWKGKTLQIEIAFEYSFSNPRGLQGFSIPASLWA